MPGSRRSAAAMIARDQRVCLPKSTLRSLAAEAAAFASSRPRPASPATRNFERSVSALSSSSENRPTAPELMPLSARGEPHASHTHPVLPPDPPGTPASAFLVYTPPATHQHGKT